MKDKFQNLLIEKSVSVLSAMKLMDEVNRKLLIVMSGEKYFGLLSIGDIQRAIIGNHEYSTPVSAIMRKDYIVARPHQKLDEIKNLMLQKRAEFMPVIDEDNNVKSIYFWEEFFGEEKKEPLFKFNLPVVVMAGGLGTRLKPLTNVLPKPLIPINDKSFIEEILDRFSKYGCDRFYISVNYKADLIEYYLKEQQLPYNLTFYREDKPLGTGGSLSLLKGKIQESFFVSNCDILIDQDFSEVLKYHKDNNNEITIIAALKHYPIAYGTIETGDNGRLLKLVEKPEFTIKINSGMYIFEPHVLDEIPYNHFLHITDLIENVYARGGKVGVFPISENSWKDIGGWKEYLKFVELNN